MFIPPYIFGFSTFLFSIFLVLRFRKHIFRIFSYIHVSLVALFSLFLFYVFQVRIVMKEVILDGSTSWDNLSGIFVVAAWWVFTLLMFRKIKKDVVWLAYRATLYGGVLSLSWFMYFLLILDWNEIIYGLWLSVFSSILLVLGGYFLEKAEFSEA